MLEHGVEHDPPGQVGARLQLREEPRRGARSDHQLAGVGLAQPGQRAHQLALT
jgi:hypothetical protein